MGEDREVDREALGMTSLSRLVILLALELVLLRCLLFRFLRITRVRNRGENGARG